MKKILINLLTLFFSLIIIYSAFKIVIYYKDNQKYSLAEGEIMTSLAKIKKEKQLQNINPKKDYDKLSLDKQSIELVEGLKEKYPAIVAWIEIPGTKISEPIVQGQDNDYYLNHTYKGDYHVFGAIYLDYRNNPNFVDQNSIIYGHNIRSGKVFNDLLKYQDPDFIHKAPIIKIHSLTGYKEYTIFAVYRADPAANFRNPSYNQDQLQVLIDLIREKNILPKERDISLENFITLQTCTDEDYRFIIQANLKNQ